MSLSESIPYLLYALESKITTKNNLINKTIIKHISICKYTAFLNPHNIDYLHAFSQNDFIKYFFNLN